MDELQKYQKIAFDFDGTLVDGVASGLIARFIRNNPEKTYFIVTFRSPLQCATIGEELDRVGLHLDQFAKLVALPARLANEFDEDQRQRRMMRLPPMGDVDHLLPGEFRFVHWKGFICSKLGAPVLVDDMPELVQPGCKQHNIKLITDRMLAAKSEPALVERSADTRRPKKSFDPK